MPLKIKFIGAFRHIIGKTQITLEYQKGSSVQQIIDTLNEKMPQLKNTLSDQALNDSRSNSLILINGREISILSGYQTLLKDEDEIVFVPVVHGG